MTEPQRTTPEPPPTGWLISYPLGAIEGIRAIGTVAAPLLSGFGLATLALLVTSDPPVRFGDTAIAAFAIGSVLFVFCVQFTASALLYAASPGERLGWLRPGEDPAVAYRVQHKDSRVLRRYVWRARVTYDVGILAHLSGLLVLVVPVELWSWRSVAFGAVALTMVVEVIWVVGGWLGVRPTWLLPDYPLSR